MGKVKTALMDILEHEYCYGYGWIYQGNNVDFDSEPCECNPYAISADELMDWKLN
jgi:hypothetical protein